MKRYKFHIIISIVVAIVLGIVFNQINYVENEGFNPSDDGVVLAQSYRLINGEVPHKDFISIRPVFSGVMHSIHFYTPWPLQISARWFVLLEIFITSLLWTLLFTAVFRKIIKTKELLVFPALLILCFFLNVNTYNLFPWTTIDAVFLSSIGIAFWYRISKNIDYCWKNTMYISIGLFFMALAASSRQNFFVLFAAASAVTLFLYFKAKAWNKIWLLMLLGGFPLISYLLYLDYNHSFQLFIEQMTGRTELLQTGVLQYAKMLYKSMLLPWYLILIVILSVRFLKPSMFYKYYHILRIAGLIHISVSVFFSIWLFFNDFDILFKVAFEYFWILFFTWLLIWFEEKPNIRLKWFGAVVLFLAWTSSISLGDNTPIFVTGVLLVSLFILNIYLLKDLKLFSKGITSYGLIVYSIVIALSGIYGQQKYNYRDLSADKLDYCLGDLFPEFGGVVTNETTFDYYKELKKILDEHPEMKDKFFMVPNNAIIYPIIDSRNPMPLDWLQQEEYVGSEQRISNQIKNFVNDNNEIYVIIDKYDSKKMAIELVELNYDIPRYDYYELLFSYSRPLPIFSKYFSIRKIDL